MEHHILSSKSIHLQQELNSRHGHLILFNNVNLQVISDLEILHRYIKKLKDAGKKIDSYQCILDHMETVELGLWEFPVKKMHLSGWYKTYKKELILQGQIHIWNKVTETYELTMEKIIRREIQKFGGNEETVFMCCGIEIFKFISVFT